MSGCIRALENLHAAYTREVNSLLEGSGLPIKVLPLEVSGDTARIGIDVPSWLYMSIIVEVEGYGSYSIRCSEIPGSSMVELHVDGNAQFTSEQVHPDHMDKCSLEDYIVGTTRAVLIEAKKKYHLVSDLAGMSVHSRSGNSFLSADGKVVAVLSDHDKKWYATVGKDL